MTTYFQYDELKWPEVDALPRDTPLVIPLGEGYQYQRLASALGNPASIGLLPPFPFGWEGSGLTVPIGYLEAYLANLANSLRDNGFSRVLILAPQGLSRIDTQAGASLSSVRISLPQKNEPPGSPFLLPSSNDTGKVVLIPVGHTEQHGYHLPMATDTIIIEAISQGTALAVPEEAVSLPVMPYGVSTHRQSFAGTLNAGGRAFEDFWVSVIDILAGRGFDRFYFLNGHGGNGSFLVNVVKYSGERHRRIFCATAWLYLTSPAGIEAIEKHRRSPIGGMGHACELETSLILCLRPNLVEMDKAVDEMDFVATPSYYMDWVEGGALIANPPWDDDTATGAYGAGSLATEENGRIWLQAAIEEKAAQVAEINEQQRRREERRKAGYGLWGRK